MTLLILLFAIKLLAQLSILNITTKLQKLYSPPKNSRVDNKVPMLFKKNLVAWAIFCMSWRYWLKYLLLAICQKSGEASFWEMMDTFILLAYESLATSGTLLHQWIACQDFTLNSEDVSFFYKRKKWFLWTMATAQIAENHGGVWGLTWYLPWELFISIASWAHSQKSLTTVKEPSLRISSHGRSLKWSLRPF